MIRGEEDLREAIIEAYSLEKGTREFYDFASSKALTELARDTFRKLRDWEESHMHYLEFLYKSLQGETEPVSYEEFSRRIPATHTEEGIPLAEAAGLFDGRDFIDDTEPIILALEIEGRAYNLYRRLSDSAEDPNAKVIFTEMMSQEEKHINSLRDLKKTTA